jgi:hypothetical protein
MMSGILSAFMTNLTNGIIIIESTIKNLFVQLATSEFFINKIFPGGVNWNDCVRIKHSLEPPCPI